MKRQIQIVFGFQAIALVLGAWIFRHALNTDAVAYLQLARHYADGRFDLAISGHWSPLIAWAVALLLKFGLSALTAARWFMLFSGIVFLWGSLCVFRRFEMAPAKLIVGLWTMALISIPWSVENITPDLLMAGLVGLAISQMAVPVWWQKPGRAILCGMTWGAAYLCKSPALPLGLVVIVTGVFWWWKNSGTENRMKIIRAGIWSVAGIGLIALPWITVLTIHTGKLTITSAASYNHALVAPRGGRSLFLLDEGLRVPASGRVTIWEDPAVPAPDWSPFASGANARHQLAIIGINVPVVLAMITSINLAFPLVAILALLSLARPADKIFWLAFMPVLILAVLFLPDFLLFSEQRYFYAAAPLLFVVSMHYVRWLARWPVLLAICFLLPNFARAGLHLGATRATGEQSFALAKVLSQKHLNGPVVGSGKVSGGRIGLNIAWWLQQPWFGDEPVPVANDYLASDASLIVVNRGSAVADDLLKSQRARNLDADLFDSSQRAMLCPVQIFQVNQSAQ